MEYPTVRPVYPEEFWRDVYFLNMANQPHERWMKWIWEIADVHRLQDDFDFFDTDHYTVTTREEHSGHATETIVNGLVCGALLLLNDGRDDDFDEVSTVASSWWIYDKYPLYFEARIKMPDALQSEFWLGLCSASTYYSGVPDDVIIFKKDDGDRNIDFYCKNFNVFELVDTGIDLADYTWIRLGCYWDGAGGMKWFIYQDGDDPRVLLAAGTIANRNAFCQLSPFFFGFGVKNGAAAAKGLYIDYYKIAMKRYSILGGYDMPLM